MNNLERIQGVFTKVFSVETSALNEDFTNDAVEQWDSVTQMALVEAIEDEFDIMLEIDDIYEMNSYNKCLEILKKYEVEL